MHGRLLGALRSPSLGCVVQETSSGQMGPIGGLTHFLWYGGRTEKGGAAPGTFLSFLLSAIGENLALERMSAIRDDEDGALNS